MNDAGFEAQNIACRGFLAALEHELSRELVGFSTVENVLPGQFVASKGPRGTAVLLVKSGVVKILRTGPLGRPYLASVLGPGDVAWMPTTWGSARRIMSVVAATESVVVVVELSQIRHWAIEHPAVADGLLEVASASLGEAHEKLAVMWMSDAASRVTAELVRLADRFGRPVNGGRGVVVDHGLTQVELSELAGVRRETLNKRLSALANMDVLLLHRNGFEVLDMAVLRALAESSPHPT